MKTTSMQALLILVPVSAFCIYADSDESTCSVKDIRGTYAIRSNGVDVTNNAPIAFAGSLTADGKGKITAWKDWVVTAAPAPIVPPNFKVVPPLRDIWEMARSLGNEIKYAVEPDCRMTISSAVPGPFPGTVTPILLVGALAANGDEALLVNAVPQVPYLTVATMKRARRGESDESK